MHYAVARVVPLVLTGTFLGVATLGLAHDVPFLVAFGLGVTLLLLVQAAVVHRGLAFDLVDEQCRPFPMPRCPCHDLPVEIHHSMRYRVRRFFMLPVAGLVTVTLLPFRRMYTAWLGGEVAIQVAHRVLVGQIDEHVANQILETSGFSARIRS